MNGAPLGERFRQRSAYVAQEELFMPTLDAWETLEFQAVLQNRRGLTKSRLHERMHDVMAVMGLSSVRHTQANHSVLFMGMPWTQVISYASAVMAVGEAAHMHGLSLCAVIVTLPVLRQSVST